MQEEVTGGDLWLDRAVDQADSASLGSSEHTLLSTMSQRALRSFAAFVTEACGKPMAQPPLTWSLPPPASGASAAWSG